MKVPVVGRRRRGLTSLSSLAIASLEALVVLVALGACGKKERLRARSRAHQVLSLGKGPRVPLRYRFRPGLTLLYRLRSEQYMVGTGRPPRPQIQHLSFAVDRVRGPRAQVRWRIEPDPDQGSHAPGGTHGGAPGRASGRSMWLQLTERGVVEAIAPGRGEGDFDAWHRQALLEVLPRLPVEALGVGARWREARTQEMRPLPKRPPVRTRLLADFTLERITPCGQTRCADLSVTVSLQMAHVVGGRRLQGKGRGRGQLRLDLGRGVMVSSSSFSEVEISISGPGVSIRELVRTRRDLEEVRPPPEIRHSLPTPAPGGRQSALGSGPRDVPRAR